jgi:hypothetical protein
MSLPCRQRSVWPRIGRCGLELRPGFDALDVLAFGCGTCALQRHLIYARRLSLIISHTVFSFLAENKRDATNELSDAGAREDVSLYTGSQVAYSFQFPRTIVVMILFESPR